MSNRGVTLEFIQCVLVEGALDRFDDFVDCSLVDLSPSPLLVHREVPGSPASDKDNFLTEIVNLRNSFPDLRYEVDEVIDDSTGKVVVRATMSGTHKGSHKSNFRFGYGRREGGALVRLHRTLTVSL